ncbi:MAG TPA: glycosyltransferase family 9 protein [Gemmatimonadales bacterium]|nr:glycosyltransferase family 9 protein [Gemmatimonadales bacterium]
MACLLLVRFSSIGDVLLTTPLVRVLRARHPDARIVFVTKRTMAPLIADNPHLSDVVALEPGESIRSLARRLAALAPTRGLDLHGSLRSTALRMLVRCPWRGYSKHKVARAVLVATKIDLYGTDIPVPERYFEAARGLDVRPDGAGPEFFIGQAATGWARQWLGEQRLEERRFAVLAPGAAHFTKRWPLDRWQATAARLRDSGFPLVTVGGADDRALGEVLAPLAVNAAGALSLQQTGALLARARLVVSGDTGVMHMATGVGTPIVALFGPTVRQFGFFPYRARSEVLERALDCRPCSVMGGARCPMGHHRCLVDISPEDVLGAAARLGLVA